MTSWLYYQHDISIISDPLYDQMCRQLAEELPALEHPHKHLVDPAALKAGTGFNLKDEDYPAMCKGAAMRLALENGFIERH